MAGGQSPGLWRSLLAQTHCFDSTAAPRHACFRKSARRLYSEAATSTLPRAAIWFRGSARTSLEESEIDLTPWQLSHALSAIKRLEKERFAEGECTMSEAERSDLYEPAGYVIKEPIKRRRLVDQLTRWLRLHSALSACTATRSGDADCTGPIPFG
jgi:hypothetical protein